MTTRPSFDEINDVTGFANGDQFTSPEQVRGYFTVENMQFMGLGGEPMVDQDTLDAWAELVIEHRLHCAF